MFYRICHDINDLFCCGQKRRDWVQSRERDGVWKWALHGVFDLFIRLSLLQSAWSASVKNISPFLFWSSHVSLWQIRAEEDLQRLVRDVSDIRNLLTNRHAAAGNGAVSSKVADSIHQQIKWWHFISRFSTRNHLSPTFSNTCEFYPNPKPQAFTLHPSPFILHATPYTPTPLHPYTPTP